MVAVVAVAVAALVGAPLGVNAYANTIPLVAWSSKQSNVLDTLPSKPSHAAPLLEDILVNDEVCDFNAVLLVEQPGLHASDLRTLPSNSPLVQAIRHAPSQRQFQYLSTKSRGTNEDDDLDFSSISEALAARCGSHPSVHSIGQINPVFHNGKAVIKVNMPSLEDRTGADRKDEIAWDAELLASSLDALLEASNSVLVVYTGSKSAHSGLYARQEGFDSHTGGAAIPSRPAASGVFDSSKSLAADKKKAGILHHYQLLTPGLIISLLVTIFILLPVPLFAFRALASIQSPLSKAGTAPKGFNAAERKNQ